MRACTSRLSSLHRTMMLSNICISISYSLLTFGCDSSVFCFALAVLEGVVYGLVDVAPNGLAGAMNAFEACFDIVEDFSAAVG